MKIKFLCAVAALGMTSVSDVAFADTAPAAPTPEFAITGSAAIVSQYRFRGLSQSDNKPAVQASFTVTDKSGFYLSTWGSSASANNSPINIGGTEIDVYGGYSHTFATSGVTADGGVYGYIYPGAVAGNYYEIYGDLSKSYGPITGKVGVNFAPAQNVFNFNFTSSARSNTYVYGELSFVPTSLPAFTVHSHLGHTGGGFDYGKQYLDYVVGASYKWKSLTLDLSGVGTNISSANVNTGFGCVGNAGCINFFHRPAKTVAVLSLTASF